MTNLIEQLGGYEKSKYEMKLKEENSILQRCSAVTADMIRAALLEYRRQHNILEIGDKVFLAETENEIQIVTERTKELFYNLGFVHCTNKEIAQGYRDEN